MGWLVRSGSDSSVACRPIKSQWALWSASPDPEFVADSGKGGPYSRGVALDLALIGADRRGLDRGAGFDAPSPLSRRGHIDVRLKAQHNWLLLAGLMTAAGFEFDANARWRRQPFDARDHPAAAQRESPSRMMN